MGCSVSQPYSLLMVSYTLSALDDMTSALDKVDLLMAPYGSSLDRYILFIRLTGNYAFRMQ